MRKGLALLAAMLVVVSSGALAADPGHKFVTQSGPAGDVSRGEFTPTRADTHWYGNADPVTGLAVYPGVWDFDSDPLGDGYFQGWTSRDMTLDIYGQLWQWVTADSFPNDPYTPMMEPDPPYVTFGQVWVGIHEDVANLNDFVTGMGYANNNCQRAFSPFLDMAQNDEFRVRFDYFNDTEPEYDYTYIYGLFYDSDEVLVTEQMLKYFDGITGDTAGLPWEDPQTFNQQFILNNIDSNTVKMKLELRFFTDGGWADEDGLWDCQGGPFSFDHMRLKRNTIDMLPGIWWEFETSDAEDWTFGICDGIGAFMSIVPQNIWEEWVELSGLICPCDMVGNALECVDETDETYYPPPHPPEQYEMLTSNIIARDPAHVGTEFNQSLVEWYSYDDLQNPAGTFLRIGYMMYPYTSLYNTDPHWSRRRGQDTYFYTGDEPACGLNRHNYNTLNGRAGDPISADWDSMRVTYELNCDCDGFGIAESTCLEFPEEGRTWGAPVLDDFRVGITGGADAPPIV
ncbi:hypothetical protein ACFL6M_04890, partial [Candidatus Eisenbacteria bacterium]